MRDESVASGVEGAVQKTDEQSRERADGSDGDELPEAFESREHRYALGVQWHPEADEESRLIAALVDAARTRAGAARPEAR